jgi:L-ascorbate metabolism protein UlaG (beta-lactamase superfamily)
MILKDRIDIERWWHSGDPVHGLEVMWLGQAGFLLRTGRHRLVIDPYLSDSLAEKYRGKTFPHTRMTAAPIAPGALGDADLVLATHEHTDHLDPDTIPFICAAGTRTPVVVPRFSLALALERGVPPHRLVTLNDGESWRSGTGITVWAIPAAHEELQRDRAGNARFLGYLLRIGDFLVYHSGDTVPCEELESVLTALLTKVPTEVPPAMATKTSAVVDLALLPVNGRDEKRRTQGVPGNLTVSEAIAYHRRFAFRHTIVHHFDMFDFNTADPGELREACRLHDLGDEITVPEMNVRYSLEPPSAPSPNHVGSNR